MRACMHVRKRILILIIIQRRFHLDLLRLILNTYSTTLITLIYYLRFIGANNYVCLPQKDVSHLVGPRVVVRCWPSLDLFLLSVFPLPVFEVLSFCQSVCLSHFSQLMNYAINNRRYSK